MPTRRTLCTQCDEALDVSSEAKSVNCPHCNTRVVTETLDVSGYVAVRRLATANRMHITKKGKVFAAVRADDLLVEGFLHGDAVSLTRLRLTKSAHVTGNVRAAFLTLEVGATLVGEVRIGPIEVPELGRLAPPGRSGSAL